VTDGQTDGQTDGIAVASTALAKRRAVKSNQQNVVSFSVSNVIFELSSL